VDNRMSMDEFKRLIAEQLGVEESLLTEETTFLNDLGIDSLSLINFVISMEKKHGIKVEMDTVFSLRSVRDAYETFIGKGDTVTDLSAKGVERV
jgi:acyl carrier protein